MTLRPSPTIVEEAMSALTGPRWNVSDASSHVPPVPGLYAIYGDQQAWIDLDLELRPASPLYVGKAEYSLVSRDLKGHFALDPSTASRTGGSTVRRSFAALLRQTLKLRAVPRNPEKPERFANYGLAADGDSRLNEWMRAHLSLAIWAAPSDRFWALKDVETAAIIKLRPLLNISGNPGKSPRLQRARASMAVEAAQWVDSR